jgi:catechol 2,3-dioxygenase-like lactoylglutathione lyase family enzyme
MAKIVTAILLLVVASFAIAQTSDSARKPEVSRPVFKAHGAFVAITVPDIDVASKWYAEKLGLKIVKDHSMRPDNKAAVTVLQGNGFAVELIWLDGSAPLSKVAPQVKGPQEIYGILKSGIYVDDLDATLKELKSRNVTMAFETFYDKSMDCRMFAIRDNNGNILQFFGK